MLWFIFYSLHVIIRLQTKSTDVTSRLRSQSEDWRVLPHIGSTLHLHYLFKGSVLRCGLCFYHWICQLGSIQDFFESCQVFFTFLAWLLVIILKKVNWISNVAIWMNGIQFGHLDIYNQMMYSICFGLHILCVLWCNMWGDMVLQRPPSDATLNISIIDNVSRI